MKLPQVQIAVREREPGADYQSIEIERAAKSNIAKAAADVVKSYEDSAASAEFITGSASAKRRRNDLHRKLGQPTISEDDLGDIVYDKKDVKDGQIPTYLVGDKIWESESKKIKDETLGGFKFNKSRNEFNARWSNSDEDSRDLVLKQMELGAKTYHKNTKEAELGQAVREKDWEVARESLEYLHREGIYTPAVYGSKKAGLNKAIESDYAYDLINNQDVEGMQSEIVRLQDKEGKYSGPRTEQERKSLIGELKTGINQVNATNNAGIAELNNQSADYVANLWGGGEIDPAFKAQVDSAAVVGTPSQKASLNKLSREITIAEEYTSKRNVMVTADAGDFESLYQQAIKDTDKIKDRRVRDSALNGLKKTYDRRKSMLATDGAGYAIETNPDVAESFEAFNNALFSGDMVSAAGLYGEYIGLTTSVQESYGVANRTILPKSSDYQAAFTKLINNSTSQQKMALAGSFAAVVGTDLIQVANELSGNNPAFVGGMMNMRTNPVAAELVFRGMEVEDSIPNNDWTNAMNDTFDGVYMDGRDQKALMASLSAHYRGAAGAEQLKDGVNSELMQNAIDDLLGPKIPASGNRSSQVYSFKDDSNEWVSPYRFNNVLDRVDNEALINTHDVSISIGGEFIPGDKSAIQKDARYGELGEIKNKDGTTSTEFSITENVPELGGWVNIPSLVEGQKDIRFLETKKFTKENLKIAINRAIERKKAGAILPVYSTMDEALKVAQSRGDNEKKVPYDQIIKGYDNANEIIKNADLIPAGDGTFYLKIQNSNPSGTNYGAIDGRVVDSNGNDFILDMRKLNRYMTQEIKIPEMKGL